MEISDILGYFGALIVGIILGLIGGGGSILTVPILVYGFGLNPIVATAYSLFIVGTTSIIGAYKKIKEGLVDVKTAIVFAIPSLIAVYITRRYLVLMIPSTVLKTDTFEITNNIFIMILFAFIMLLASISMIFSKNSEDKTQEGTNFNNNFLLIAFEGILVGLLTGLVGAGGGFLIVPALVLLAKLPMKEAVGTSLLIVASKSLIGFLGDLPNLNVDWSLLLIFTSISIIGIYLGVYLSQFISGKKLKKGFGYFIFFMAFYIIYKELL